MSISLKFKMFLVLLTLPTCYLAAQTNMLFEKKVFKKGNVSIPYRLAYPANYQEGRKYPLVLFLHGAGVRGTDNEAQLTGVPKALTDSAGRLRFPCFILAPQCDKEDVWVKFPHFPESVSTTADPTISAQAVLALLQSIVTNKAVDRNRIYITGYSMGGEGTFYLLTRQPQTFAAAIPICSVADTSKAKLITAIPIWAFHGDQDDVNNVKYSRMMIAELRKLGSNAIYTEYPGVKHDSWKKAYIEPYLFDWLFKQIRPAGKRK